MSKKININNLVINIKTSPQENDFISLTDMAKWKNAEAPDQVIANWMRTNFTIQFLGLWEIDKNPDLPMIDNSHSGEPPAKRQPPSQSFAQRYASEKGRSSAIQRGGP